jgi:hypothetical protein
VLPPRERTWRTRNISSRRLLSVANWLRGFPRRLILRLVLAQNATPRYSATIEDLEHADEVTVLCTCGHRSAVAVGTIATKLSPRTRVVDVRRRMRCRVCRALGDCTVDANAALGWGATST